MARLHDGGSTVPVPGPAPGWLEGPPLVLPALPSLPVLESRAAAPAPCACCVGGHAAPVHTLNHKVSCTLAPAPCACSVGGHAASVHTLNPKVSCILAQAPPTGIRERWDALGGDGKENVAFGLAFLLVAAATLGYAHRVNRSLHRLDGVASARGSASGSGRYLGSAVREDLGDIAPRYSLRRLPFLARYTRHRTL